MNYFLQLHYFADFKVSDCTILQFSKFMTALFCRFSDGEEVAEQPPEGEGAGNSECGRARQQPAAETREAARRELYGAVEQSKQDERNQGGVIAQGLAGIA